MPRARPIRGHVAAPYPFNRYGFSQNMRNPHIVPFSRRFSTTPPRAAPRAAPHFSLVVYAPHAAPRDDGRFQQLRNLLLQSLPPKNCVRSFQRWGSLRAALRIRRTSHESKRIQLFTNVWGGSRPRRGFRSDSMATTTGTPTVQRLGLSPRVRRSSLPTALPSTTLSSPSGLDDLASGSTLGNPLARMGAVPVCLWRRNSSFCGSTGLPELETPGAGMVGRPHSLSRSSSTASLTGDDASRPAGAAATRRPRSRRSSSSAAASTVATARRVSLSGPVPLPSTRGGAGVPADTVRASEGPIQIGFFSFLEGKVNRRDFTWSACDAVPNHLRSVGVEPFLA